MLSKVKTGDNSESTDMNAVCLFLISWLEKYTPNDCCIYTVNHFYTSSKSLSQIGQAILVCNMYVKFEIFHKLELVEPHNQWQRESLRAPAKRKRSNDKSDKVDSPHKESFLACHTQ